MIPASSAAQLANTMDRLGLQPALSLEPNTLPTSIMMAVPLLGSTAPYPQASRWFPNMTNRSGSSEP